MGKMQKYLAEVLGTFTLVVVGSFAIVSASAGESLGIVSIALGFGLALLIGLYAFAEVSGGHFNPAVSLAMFLDRRLSMEDMIGYWISQVIGAIARVGRRAHRLRRHRRRSDDDAGVGHVGGDRGRGRPQRVVRRRDPAFDDERALRRERRCSRSRSRSSRSTSPRSPSAVRRSTRRGASAPRSWARSSTTSGST